MSSIGLFSFLQLVDTDIDHSFRDLPGASLGTSHLLDRQVGPSSFESYHLRFAISDRTSREEKTRMRSGADICFRK